ncbi:MAG TPA: polyphosphate polymerase domain-containing protein [Anaerolineaceae bacterium]|nr:polyphosphate polymerase domain-containing protein [Anaerolineaceae bacterium]
MITNRMIKTCPDSEKTLLVPALSAKTHSAGMIIRALEQTLSHFSPIRLEEMDSITLQDRVDTKFILPVELLVPVLDAVMKEYQILTIDGNRINHYRTVYFDTPDFYLFNLHVNGNAERYKVRSREYLESGQTFFEVKYKTRKDRTIKNRKPTSQAITKVDAEAKKWLKKTCPLESTNLEAKIWNTFSRITLANIERSERATIDFDILFSNGDNEKRLDGIAIIEIKSDRQIKNSPLREELFSRRIHPSGFSKYCIGTALLYTGVKKNALKPQILWIEKISQGVI